MKDRPYFYALGKRKTARATVKLYFAGSGEFKVNGEKLIDWADDRGMILLAQKPLELLGMKKSVDVEVRTSGGGKQAQSDAIRLGISRAFAKKDGAYRIQLKEESLLTRDPRRKERKKPGLKRARKASQFSKR